MRVVRVWTDHRRNCVILEAEGTHDTRLNLHVDPRDLHDRARVALGPPPLTPTAFDMESAIRASLLGVHVEDPRETYRKKAAEVAKGYLSHALRGAEVPEEAALAALDGKEWVER